MAEMGRPQAEFDWKRFDTLCAFPDVITQEDIAEAMLVSVDTCDRRIKDKDGCTFAEYRTKKQGGLRTSLFSYQMKQAEKGNPTMLIWLGKQYLGQSDKQVHELSGAPVIRLAYALDKPT